MTRPLVYLTSVFFSYMNAFIDYFASGAITFAEGRYAQAKELLELAINSRRHYLRHTLDENDPIVTQELKSVDSIEGSVEHHENPSLVSMSIGKKIQYSNWHILY